VRAIAALRARAAACAALRDARRPCNPRFSSSAHAPTHTHAPPLTPGPAWRCPLATRTQLDHEQPPPIQRDAAQVAELSRQLKARTPRLDASAAARSGQSLLAREGADPDRLAREIRYFEPRTTCVRAGGCARVCACCVLRTRAHRENCLSSAQTALCSLALPRSYETAVAPEAESVEEYLERVQADITKAAIEARAHTTQHNTLPRTHTHPKAPSPHPHTRHALTHTHRAAHTPATSPHAPLAHQEVHRDTAADFESFMLDSLEREWDAEKASLAAGLGPISAFGGAAAALAAATPGAGAAARAAAGAASPFVPGRGGVGGAAAAAAAERDATYFEVVKAINDARLGAGPALDAAARFGAAAAAAAGGGGAAGAGGATLPELWRSLSCVLSRGGAEGCLVEGALRHLADGHKRYMEATVARDPSAAALGGTAAPLALVHAFLRAKLRGAGPLDFDGAPPGGGAVVDTAWQVAYYCARSGFMDEAAAAAQAAATSRGLGRNIAAAMLVVASTARAGGAGGAGGPSGAAAAEAYARASEDAEAALREAPPAAGRAFRLALGAALCGDARAGDAAHAACPELFGTIEDFLWHKLTLVRSGAAAVAASAALPGTPATPGAPASASALVPYMLSDLQAYLARFEPAHYAKGGREPLLAATVLVLSLRFAAALSFLAEDPLAEGYALDGVHVAAALTAAGALRGAGGERGADVAGAAARLLASYGRQCAAPAPARAAEYFALAAEAAACAARAAAPQRGPGAAAAAAAAPGTAADATAVLEALLRELLRHPGAAAPLLGASGVDGGALARFVPDGSRRRDLVSVAAGECRAAALTEQAMELHTRAGEPGAALELLNGKLADALTAAAVAPSAAAADAAAAACAALLARGADLAAAAAARGERAQTAAFAALRVVEALLRDARAGRHAQVLSRWRDSPELRFVPIDMLRAPRAAAELDELHPGVAARLPDVLLACAAALAAPGAARVLGSDADVNAAKAALTTLAGAARFHIPPHVYGQLARLATAPMQS
jgi:hypothetical protein